MVLHLKAMKGASVVLLNQGASGINQQVFREIQAEFRLIREDIGFPLTARLFHAAKTFSPVLRQWKARFDKAHGDFLRSPSAFRARSRIASLAVKRHIGRASTVFQLGGMYDGFEHAEGMRKVIFADFTTTLAWREWKPWAPKDEASYREWVELERSYYHRADLILVASRHALRSFREDYGIREQRLRLFPYCCSFEASPPPVPPGPNPAALFVGCDFVRKGGPALLEAFRIVRSRLPAARLKIIGPSSLPKGLPAGVEHLTFVSDRARLQRHFLEAAFFVLPSLCEPFGMVLLEAMMCGKACVGSRVDAMAEIIEDGTTGYLVEPGSVKQLADSMTRLFERPDLASRLGEEGRKKVLGGYTWQIGGQRLRDALRPEGQGMARGRA